MKVTLIHNPDAGSDDLTCGEEPVELIRRAGHQLVYQSSKDSHWKTVLNKPADIIAVAGGDGIVGAVAEVMIGKGTPIAVLPLGTANNIAKTLNLMDLSLQPSDPARPIDRTRRVELARRMRKIEDGADVFGLQVVATPGHHRVTSPCSIPHRGSLLRATP